MFLDFVAPTNIGTINKCVGNHSTNNQINDIIIQNWSLSVCIHPPQIPVFENLTTKAMKFEA